MDTSRRAASSHLIGESQRSISLDGKVALVSGASRGIGRSVAESFSRSGAKVVILARDSARLADLYRQISQNDGEAVVISGSVEQKAVAHEAVRTAVETWGHLDILVNCAGVSPSFDLPQEIELETWRQILDINATGTFQMCQAAHPEMAKAGSGSIINLSSVHGQVGHARLAAYSASKGAVEMMSQSMALAWADDGVRVNTVAPGYVETDMTESLRQSERWRGILLDQVPLHRFAKPQEIVNAIAFLASDLSSYMTGARLTVDGGWTAK